MQFNQFAKTLLNIRSEIWRRSLNQKNNLLQMKKKNTCSKSAITTLARNMYQCYSYLRARLAVKCPQRVLNEKKRY